MLLRDACIEDADQFGVCEPQFRSRRCCLPELSGGGTGEDARELGRSGVFALRSELARGRADVEGVGGKGESERRGGGRFQFGDGLFQLCSRIRSCSGSGVLGRE